MKPRPGMEHRDPVPSRAGGRAKTVVLGARSRARAAALLTWTCLRILDKVFHHDALAAIISREKLRHSRIPRFDGTIPFGKPASQSRAFLWIETQIDQNDISPARNSSPAHSKPVLTASVHREAGRHPDTQAGRADHPPQFVLSTSHPRPLFCGCDRLRGMGRDPGAPFPVVVPSPVGADRHGGVGSSPI